MQGIGLLVFLGAARAGKTLASSVWADGRSRQRAGGLRSHCYHGRTVKEFFSYAYYADLEAMARASDCLAVTCPLMRRHSLIDARIRDALGRRDSGQRRTRRGGR